MALKDWNIFSPSRKVLKKARRLAEHIDNMGPEFRRKSNDELSQMTPYLIEKLKKGHSLDDILPEAFATIREAIYRVHGLYAFKVQLIGAIVAHEGDFAEMYTGEGKTLVIVMVAYLNALLKRGVHIVTVNEYLVQRDAQFCAQCVNPLGLTVGYNLADFEANEKRKMFACDITYTTNSELGFDYLRDNMVQRYEDKVIRELNYAIIDEADSVLIDEARTPLIISGQPKEDVSGYIEADKFTCKLLPDDYKIDMETHTINLTESGVKKAQEKFKVANIFNFGNSDLYHKIKNALMANFVFREGVEYIVRDDKIALVDQSTGRIMEGRSYNAGLHQAIQAKEKVEIEPENVTVATITYQSFFRLYKKLAGVSGTAATESEEFLKIYNMLVVTIPTNRPVIRKDNNDFIFANKVSKWAHVVAEIQRLHDKGQPVLVGTESVEDSEELVYFLKNKGIKFELLNAKNHAKEAAIVAMAGQKGAVTISTNMAGRGTDIKLGPGVKELGGLYVIGTGHHESRRIDNQLRGRSGRQGDPGTTRFFISLEDTLFRRFNIDYEKQSSNELDKDYFRSGFWTRIVRRAQKKVEAFNYDSRKNLIDYDSVLSNQRELIYKQRDQILLNKTNVRIAKNMAKQVAADLVELFKSPVNPLFVDPDRLANAVNTRIFNSSLVSPKFFEAKTLEEAKTILVNIICLSIDKRVELLTEERANMLFRDIMIQSLDTNWTAHLDLMLRLREGVSLRSLEQKSPLNIYVDEGDAFFNELKKNVAHNVIINISRIYVPKINEEIFNALGKILPDLNISHEAYNEVVEKANQEKISRAFAGQANVNTANTGGLKINFRPSKDGNIEVVAQGPEGKKLTPEQKAQAQQAIQQIFSRMQVKRAPQSKVEEIKKSEHISKAKEAAEMMVMDVKPVEGNWKTVEHLDGNYGGVTPHEVNFTQKVEVKKEPTKKLKTSTLKTTRLKTSRLKTTKLKTQKLQTKKIKK